MKKQMNWLKMGLALPCFALFFGGCLERSKGDLMTKIFSETNFHGLEIDVPGNVEVRVDSIFSIEVTAEETALPHLEVSVSGGILRVKFDKNLFDVDDLTIKVSAPTWDFFEVNGSADIVVLDSISGQNLSYEVSGSGNLEIEKAHFLKTKIEINGSGDCLLNGKTDDLNIEVSGSGDLDCLDFLAKNVRIDISGSGDAKVNASEKLDVEISGSGDVRFLGEPQISTDISGSGTVKKL